MFKKLMVLFFGVALCFGTIGCGEGEVTTPENVEDAPTEEPGSETMEMEAPE